MLGLADGSWQGLGFALAALHDYPAAYDAFGRALAVNAGSMYNKLGLASLQLSDAKASQAALDALIASSSGNDAYQIAEVYALRGEKDLAFEWLERSYRQQDGGLTYLKMDPYFTSLRSDPRYAAFPKKLNFPP
jgi:tetratricopeptide (TPR) repeat protein